MSESDLPPYEPRRILQAPFPERIRLVCRTWAAQVNPNPLSVLALYWAKYFVLFIGGWAFFVSFSAGYPGFTSPLAWAFTLGAFQKALLWALFYESAGFGCSSGPMNARYSPPLGGFLYFLRPGTTKLPLFPGAPVVGARTRGWLDVGLYAANQLLLLRALFAAEVTPDLLWPIVVLIPLMGVLDKTLFLAARGEHYWVALVCLTVAFEGGLWLSYAKGIWCCIWFWAATSKINHHFPSVIMVMMNNGPFFPGFLKKRLFAHFPDDLRPSRLATAMAHTGTFTEYLIPFALVLSAGHAELTVLFLLLMAGFHGFIAVNNPAGMPVEWNILMVYGGVFLFGFHPEASLSAIGQMPLLALFLFAFGVAIPLYGNFFPSRVSFLMAMRYYAGNWAYNVWLFRGNSSDKLKRLKKPAGTLREQLAPMLGHDEELLDLAAAMGVAQRFMHFEGRPLHDLIPKAVDDIDDYEWMEGEILCGMIVGWNFGDGHLNGTQLLESVQAQCGFEPGELRVVMVESQPLFGRAMAWKIVDAADGVLEEGSTRIADMRGRQPWPEGEAAEAFVRGNLRIPGAR